MVSEAYQDFYLSFQRELLQFQNTLQKRENSSALQKAFQELQQSLQSLLALDNSQLDAASAAKLQSYQTEMSRLMRLLGMDILFLQAARQSATADQRLQQASDRVERLLQYCEAVLGRRDEG
jgi:glutathione S-transferase